jgi:hypothetical protein
MILILYYICYYFLVKNRLKPYLIHPKIQKLFKILHHFKYCGTCIKY